MIIRKAKTNEDIERIRLADIDLLGGAYGDYSGHWWIAWDDGRVAGFSGYEYFRPGSVFFCRAGVYPAYRGRGLQRRFMYVKLRHCRKHGVKCAVTYTTSDNIHSANNMIEAGFRLYEPTNYWGGRDALYFRKFL